MPNATELERGNYFILNGEPVRVTKKEVVAVGTHSHSKLKIFYTLMNGGGERSINLQHTDKVDIVDIIRKHGQVISKINNKVQLMDMISYETFDATSSKELMDELKEGDNVTFVSFRGIVQILEKR